MALSIADLLDIWRKVLPEGYTYPIENEDNGKGVDVIAGLAAMLERIAVDVEVTTQAMYINPHSIQVYDPAGGGVQSTGTISVTRTAPTFGDVELEDGDSLSTKLTSPDGLEVVEMQLEIDGDQTFTGGSVGPVSINVRSEKDGFHTNAPVSVGRTVEFLRRLTATVVDATTTTANKITAGGAGDQFDGGMIGAFVRFTGGTNIVTYPRRITAYDSTTGEITVDGPSIIAAVGTEDIEVVDVQTLGLSPELETDLTGGVSPWLDQIGGDKNRGRNAGESDAVYRERIRQLPDIVAPNSIYRACSRILTPLGIPFEFRETRGRVHYEFRGFFADQDPCDDPNASAGDNQRVVLGSPFDVMGFIVIVEKSGEGDFGGFADYDPPASIGARNAVDFMGCDGFPATFWSHMQALINEVESVKMAGIPWLLVLVDSL